MNTPLFKIKDWAGNDKITNQLFTSIDDAWDAILTALPDANDEDLGEFFVIQVGGVQ